jgi:formylglycine-generating enzyme required for sulfatase activity/serine/threonine protein kinase
MVKPADQTIPVGDLIEEFRVVRILGAGNFGIVYEAENIHLDETVAIKEFLPTELARRDPDGQIRPLSPATTEAFEWARSRFLQEARTLWGLGHPIPHRSIVRVTRYREANGSAYMFMEFEHGQALSDLLEQRGTLPYEELEPIILSLLEGLERVHLANILHRDIKPANILIRPDGSPVFIDFGAARNVAVSGETSVFTTYTPRYAAIEQHDSSGKQGPWTDIYALGATLYRAVTGVTPRSAAEQLLGQPQEPASELARGRYPDAFLRAIDAACALKPEDRPQSVEAWRTRLFTPEGPTAEATVVLPRVSSTDLTRVTATPTRIPSSTPPTNPRDATAVTGVAAPATQSHRSPWRWILGGVLLITVGGAAGWWWWIRQLPPPPPVEPIAPAPAPVEPMPVEPAPVEPVPVEPVPVEPMPVDPVPVEPVPVEPVPVEPTPVEPTPVEPVSVEPGALEPIKPNQIFSDPLEISGQGPTMVGIPSGTFMMGSPIEETGHNDDERLHSEQIAQVFAMSQTEVTIGQLGRFIQASGYRTEADRESACLRIDESGTNLVADLSLSWHSPGYPVKDLHPVTCVTWNDARAYAEWLSEQTGRTYRLPTEAEWEYAARAMSKTSRYWGDDPSAGCRYANTADETVLDAADDRRRIEGARATCRDGHVYSAPVGRFAANPFGLHDMIGNVAEWTCSVYDSSYAGGQARCLDTKRRTGPSPMVLRGGSWLSAPDLARAAARDGLPSNLSLSTIGFRVLATDEPWRRRTAAP